jgi:DNA-binding transcriptional regulator YiaG
MTDDIADEYVYQGLGFPIKLKKVPMMSFAGELHPVIDVKKVAAQAMQDLVASKEKLTGNQVAFIRTDLKMTTSQFGELVKAEKKQVIKWEAFADKATDMNAAAEVLLKSQVQHQIATNKKNNLLSSKGIFSDSQKKHKPEQKLETPPSKKKKPR